MRLYISRGKCEGGNDMAAFGHQKALRESTGFTVKHPSKMAVSLAICNPFLSVGCTLQSGDKFPESRFQSVKQLIAWGLFGRWIAWFVDQCVSRCVKRLIVGVFSYLILQFANLSFQGIPITFDFMDLIQVAVLCFVSLPNYFARSLSCYWRDLRGWRRGNRGGLGLYRAKCTYDSQKQAYTEGENSFIHGWIPPKVCLLCTLCGLTIPRWTVPAAPSGAEQENANQNQQDDENTLHATGHGRVPPRAIVSLNSLLQVNNPGVLGVTA